MQPSKCNVKRSIRALSQISTMAPIFQQYNYFRQNSEENDNYHGDGSDGGGDDCNSDGDDDD